MRVAVIANARAGRGRSRARAAALADDLRRRGVSAEVIEPAASGVDEALRACASEVPDAMIACGGDGTVHRVLQAIAGTDIRLGVLPAGTGNDIATELGLPPESELAEAIASGRSRSVDAGILRPSTGSPRWFLGVASTGFDSTVNERANRITWVDGRARYLVGVVAELARLAPTPTILTVDGEEHVGKTVLVSIANAGRYGGGMRICPDARVDDGLLDVTWVDAIGRAELMRVLPQVFSGAHVRHPAVRTFRGQRVRVQTSGQVAYADGERVGDLPVDVEAVPSAVHLVSST